MSRDHWKPHYSEELDRIINTCYESEKISPSRRAELSEILRRLHAAIQQYMLNYGHKMAMHFYLKVFGSTENGFGTGTSDLDVCYHHGGSLNVTAYQKSQMQKEAVGDFAWALHFAGFRANPIQVPIVKFACASGEFGREIAGDISYYNELALYNTRLLRRYCSWTKNDTLSKLGIFVKKWAKHCDIKDASKGSLSSYAYCILLIHFLQRLQPHPLLPVLQEMGEKKEVNVDEHDVYFCDDEPNPDWSQCTLSVGELFLQFLDYYDKFDWKNEVVQIRQTKKLMKQEIGWTTQISIQDPFELNHNLAYRVSKKMTQFIKRSIAASREVFFSLSERENFILTNGGRDEDVDRPIPEGFIYRYGEALLAQCYIGPAPRYGTDHR